MTGATQTISASEFKAKCLDILDRVHRREIDQVIITKRGEIVATLVPPPATQVAVDQLHGFLRGSVVIEGDLDLTDPILDEAFNAEHGATHG